MGGGTRVEGVNRRNGKQKNKRKITALSHCLDIVLSLVLPGPRVPRLPANSWELMSRFRSGSSAHPHR